MRLLSHLLRHKVRSGRLEVTDAGGRLHVFEGAEGGGPRAAIRLRDHAIAWRIGLRPRLAFGEAYMDGRLTVERGDIFDFIDLCAANYASYTTHPVTRLWHALGWMLRPLGQINPIGRARRNAAHHYDLSDELYSLFLDHDRQYSCAYFNDPGDGLDLAQENKKRHIAAKLLLRPGMKVLDIGCGWGGLALTLAEQYGVEVLGVTLSQRQLEAARRRAQGKGLESRVRFELLDYRQADGQFDRIVSVGMFEHVGVPHYRAFFGKLRDLLKPDGVALLHSIGCMSGPHPLDPWISKYIFPGGYIPGLSEVLPAVERCRLYATDIELLYPHYADTIRAWRNRFAASRHRAAELYDERFCRMWEFYLACSEIAFRRLNHMVFQMQLVRDPFAVPATRDYIHAGEREARRQRPTLVPDRQAG
ncbi:MAG: class I SAM-dependent methyltransferase [Rhodospirillales bacterium]